MDKICEENFKKANHRNLDGCYVVNQMVEPNNIDIGHTRRIPLTQFVRNEWTFLKMPKVKAEYDKAIIEYLELGQKKKVEKNTSDKATRYYLSQHAVIKTDYITTKLGVLFTASCALQII